MAPDEKILHQDDVEEVIDDQVPASLVTEGADAVLDENIDDQVPESLQTEESEEVLEDYIEGLSTQVAVANLPAPSAAYVEAEAIAITNRLNLLTQVLRDMNAIPSA